jgi:glyoxylase-like metal-dependent hydrolase (beta-lactamase superfamily II)
MTIEEAARQRLACRREPVQVGRLNVFQIVSTFKGQNCYVIADTQYATAVVIDPGYGTCVVVDRLLAEVGCTLAYIVLTHAHIDHIAKLRAHWPCKVIATTETSDLLPFPKRNLSAFYAVPYVAEHADVLLTGDCDRLLWGSKEMILHASPGHTEGCLMVELPGMLFTGDTLIKDTKTVVKLPGGNRTSLAKSLKYIFDTFPTGYIMFPGHGESIVLGDTQPEIHCPFYERQSNAKVGI